MLKYKGPQTVEFVGSEAMRLGNADRVEPKLRDVVTMLNMDVWRLRSFETVEKETKPQDRRTVGIGHPQFLTYDLTQFVSTASRGAAPAP